jgi:transposase
LADWLEQCQIQTVAMESTGVYWIPIMQILEDRGPQVYLVNARYARMFLAGEPMYRIANRFSNSTLLGC